MIGLGYIGLPTASVIASKGLHVHGVDVNAEAVRLINNGDIHIHEPDLRGLVREVVDQGLLKAAPEPTKAEVFMIAVPTPFKEGHSPDLSFVEAAANAIAPYLEPGNLVILESTSPVGTTERIAALIKAARPDLKVPTRGSMLPGGQGEQLYIAYCPERVLPGKILIELIHNDRVIGGLDEPSTERARALYATFVQGELCLSEARTSEMCKLVENAFRDVNIAYANELSMICDELDIDVWKLIDLANRHPRVQILRPGPGVGGHCIAVDPWFIVHSSEKSKLIRAAREVNDGKPHWVLSKLKHSARRFKDPVIALLGLAFKADIDDLRESPAMEIAKAVAAEELGKLLIAEPYISKLPAALEGKATLVSAYDAVREADLVVLLVDHRPFREIGPTQLEGKAVFDTCGMWRR